MTKLNQFDRIAGVYDRLAGLAFGRAIKKSQLQFLSYIPGQANVLILGGGSGWIIKELIEVVPDAKICYVEASEKMISMARKASLHRDVEFIHGTHADLISEVEYDIVITNFFFDLFPTSDLTKVVSQISRSLKPDGYWLVAEFICNSRWQQIYLRLMYIFFSLTCGLKTGELPNWKSVLDKAGFTKSCHRHYFSGFIESAVFAKS